jgi:hypothetical protein
MKTNTVSFSVFGVLVITALLVIGILKIQQAYAQVDATSSDIVATSSDSTNPITDATTPLVLGESTSTAPSADAAPSSTESTPTDTSPSAAATPSVSVAPSEPPPQGLTLVHIIGTKYIDYFTDGTSVTSYPGDPDIDAHLSEKDAPIPTHTGLTWDHTTGQYLYDTPSGDLEVGDYATQPNGTYIENAPPFVSSTSTPAVSGVTSDSSSSTQQSDSDTTTAQSTTSAPAAADTSTTTTF